MRWSERGRTEMRGAGSSQDGLSESSLDSSSIERHESSPRGRGAAVDESRAEEVQRTREGFLRVHGGWISHSELERLRCLRTRVVFVGGAPAEVGHVRGGQVDIAGYLVPFSLSRKIAAKVGLRESLTRCAQIPFPNCADVPITAIAKNAHFSISASANLSSRARQHALSRSLLLCRSTR